MQRPIRRMIGTISIVSFLSGCAGHDVSIRPDTLRQYAMTDRESAQSYINAKDPSPVEGIWARDDNAFQVAIIRDKLHAAPDHDFIGIVIQTTDREWKLGRLAFILNSGISDTTFPGMYIDEDKDQHGTTVVLSTHDAFEFTADTGYYGRREVFHFIRTR